MAPICIFEMDDVKPTEERGAWERGLGNAFPEMDDVKPNGFFVVWEMRFPKLVTSNQTEFL